MIRLPLPLAIAALSALGAPSSASTLVIAGGALSADNAAVWKSFLAARPADRPLLLIVPAASSSPAQAAASTAATLVRHGARADDIRVLRLATEDDRSTPEDERKWAGNVGDPALLALVEAAGGIWFTGGDQARITRLLLRPDGSDTLLLAAMRRRLAEGAVIGGTSAGAAIMSRTMIARGDSLVALLEPVIRDAIGSSGRDGGPMALTPGLGFFPHGLVDQHFDRRARLGRLARATHEAGSDGQPAIGFGIDEDSALLVDLASASARPLGAATVTVVDVRAARTASRGGLFAATGIRLSVMSAGDRLSLPDLALTPAAFKQPLAGREQDDHQVADGGGMAIGHSSLEELVGGALMDNRGTRRIERVTVAGRHAILYRFEQGPGATAWGGRDPDGRFRYAVDRVGFSIQPATARITPVKGIP